ncbi:MAG: hypothetical protein HYR63_26585 [Proteobacteria bacterium]|nr:hypothetical protein [Pseudomonadota bacterium]MBI3495978.1 hypothetical protein [Pseudomonadota bacterium]
MSVAFAPFARKAANAAAANDPAPAWEPYPEPVRASVSQQSQKKPEMAAAAARSAMRLRAAQVFEAEPERTQRAVAVDPTRQAVSAPQYLRELESFQRLQFQGEIGKTVMTVTPAEVEAAIRLAARLKGRYLAKVLDSGATNKRPFGDLETKELARTREMSEEMQRGIEALRKAIESGELQIPGVRRA